MREIPSPNYDREVSVLVRAYERALRDIRSELNTLFLTDFERAQILAVEANILEILRQLDGSSTKWIAETMPGFVRNGAADAIYTLGLAKTVEEARNIVQFNRLNRTFVETIIADTQTDLLAVTTNVRRRTKNAIREVAGEVMRRNYASGINAPQTLSREVEREFRKKLGDAADNAIIDAAGRKWKVGTYTDMLVQTKAMTAHRDGTVNEALGREVYYGVISRHGALDDCGKYEGKIVKLVPEAPGDYPYLYTLPRREIFHPHCKHIVTPVRRPDRINPEQDYEGEEIEV
ncbi:phage minor capsid protein [Brevibacillus daliensis]|uniref:phage minor capsid protein n=1 Tax=Brevibacillus daliensis TaxID=2892995 RepID=UPI001E31F3F1|nr:phage minor capsid protein [Brevibacillus daliensis]